MLFRNQLIQLSKRNRTALIKQRTFSVCTPCRIAAVVQLRDWNLENFRETAYKQSSPVVLPFIEDALPPACRKWFLHDKQPHHDLNRQPQVSELRTAFWSEHESTMVPLELTSNTPQGSSFNRSFAPLKVLLTYLGNPKSPSSSPLQEEHAFYLAQCDLDSLPESLKSDLPIPELVTSSGKGDIYSSSLWMGRPPTYTPLHRDPNPNFFLQLAGQKIIRLFPPEVGDAIFEDVQERLAAQKQGSASSASFRGEEMMQGPEKELLHQITWAESDEQSLLAYAVEAKLGLGEGLFIPKGWWHSVRGIGEGVTASANWWFR